MAKAKNKEVKAEIVSSESGAVPTPYQGMQAKDLSLEKRVELYGKEFDKFKSDMANQFGLNIDVEVMVHPKGIMPRMVLVDLLAKKDEQAKAN